MADLSDQRTDTVNEAAPTQEKKRQPLSDAERAQIKFLLRTLAIIVLMVIVAVSVVGTIVTVIY